MNAAPAPRDEAAEFASTELARCWHERAANSVADGGWVGSRAAAAAEGQGRVKRGEAGGAAARAAAVRAGRDRDGRGDRVADHLFDLAFLAALRLAVPG